MHCLERQQQVAKGANAKCGCSFVCLCCKQLHFEQLCFIQTVMFPVPFVGGDGGGPTPPPAPPAPTPPPAPIGGGAPGTPKSTPPAGAADPGGIPPQANRKLTETCRFEQQ
jgi:hypothetical protein